MASSSSYPAEALGEHGLIDNAYQVLVEQNLPFYGGGLTAFAVRDHRHDNPHLMAIQSAEGSPERPFALTNLRSTPIDNILLPVAHGPARGLDGREAWFLILPQPPGNPVRMPSPTTGVAQRVWDEGELLECVLHPVAQALDHLSNTGMTHRAIRAHNVFQAKPGQAVTLGCAWAGPPAVLQPALFEPPYSGMCHPSARGDGTIADDIYALGVLLVALSSGKPLLEGLDDDAVIRLKMERGCFAAISGDLRLPPTIADLVQRMLAYNPEHRPSAVSLLTPVTARGRRVVARPKQHTQRPILVGSIPVSNARSLGFELIRQPEAAMKLLADRSIGTWIRRTLGDAALAGRIEEAVRAHAADLSANRVGADPTLIMCTVAILDPQAPLCWRGVALFPNGLGPMFAHAHIGATSAGLSIPDILVDLVQSEAAVRWSDAYGNQSQMPSLRSESRQRRALLHINLWGGGLSRLRYTLNPLLPCRSPLLGNFSVARLPDLLPALERLTAGNTEMIDLEIAAFIAARTNDRFMDTDLAILIDAGNSEAMAPGYRGLAELRVFACLAILNPSLRWPKTASRLLKKVIPAIAQWRGRTIRASCETNLLAAAERGLVVSMSQIFEDSHTRLQDRLAGQRAEQELNAIERKLRNHQTNQHHHNGLARIAGQEIATAIGVIDLAISAIISAL